MCHEQAQFPTLEVATAVMCMHPGMKKGTKPTPVQDPKIDGGPDDRQKYVADRSLEKETKLALFEFFWS